MPNEPGWFPDPWRPGRRRWWDGGQWTDHTHDPEHEAAADQPAAPAPTRSTPPAPPPAVGPAAPDPHRDLALEQVAARRAHPALALQAAAQIVNLVTTAFVASDIRAAFEGDGATSTSSGWQASQNLATVPALVALVLLILWSHRVATIAANLHYPARRSPVWAAVGWLIPIANTWIPYRSLRDSLSPGHPAQRLVGRWWACYMVSTYWVILVLVVGLTSSTTALAVAIPGIVTALVGARLGWEVVDAVLADHTAAIHRVVPGR